MPSPSLYSAFDRPITPDIVDTLIDFHRRTFGGFTWNANENDGDTGGNSGDGDESPVTLDSGQTSFTQDQVNALLAEQKRKIRERYADYDVIKKKAEEYDKALEESKSETERAIEAARSEGERIAAERANARIVRAEAKTLAALANFRDPGDAIAFLDLSRFAVSDDGEVDADAIKSALAKLAADKPYLVDDGKTGTPRPDFSQGRGISNDKPSVEAGREMFLKRKGKAPANAGS